MPESMARLLVVSEREAKDESTRTPEPVRRCATPAPIAPGETIAMIGGGIVAASRTIGGGVFWPPDPDINIDRISLSTSTDKKCSHA